MTSPTSTSNSAPWFSITIPSTISIIQSLRL
jgi:hypothetical protein